MIAVGEAAPLYETSSALLILKGRLDSHAPCVFTHPLMRSWPIREEQPCFLVSWFPARAEPADELLLFPQQDFSIPLLAFFLHHLLALLPLLIATAQLSSEPLLIFDA